LAFTDFENFQVLTGVTGSLGTHLLSQLLEKPCVKEIVCLVRAESSAGALDRILSALISRSLPMLNITKIRAFAANLSEPDFGLGPDIIDEFHETVTTVIHSAWAVNFNLGTKSFEQQHIKGTYNLINLCLASRRSSPARFFFCSSISVAAGTPLPAHIAESPVPKLEHAQNMGYARSKLVVERIVQNAAEKTGMVAKVLRIGQISGDTQAGQWNSTEAIPLMIQSAITMKALPALDESPSWLPVDIVAKTILDLTCIHETADGNNQKFLFDPKTVYHVQNPKLFHWTNELLPALKKAGLDFEIVSQREWVRRLREGEQNPTKNPTIKLLDFYVDKYDNDYVTRSGLSFETTKTEAASPSLRGGVDLIGSGLISKFVEQWRKEW
jgi:thioester reductase-like protein